MKKMLITGASGFLGSRAARYFAKDYVLFTPTHQQMDITQPDIVEAVISEIRPDVVIHCAAMSDTMRCRQEPETSWKRNVDGSVHVAQAAGKVGAKCLLCSSDQVYYATGENVYGRQKLAAEQQGLKVNPDSVFLRLSWMYDPVPLEVSRHRDFFTNLLPLLPAQEQVAYPVFDRRGITDVNEVVRNMEKALALPGGAYNFGAPNDKNMYETAAALFAGLGLSPNRVRENREVFRDNPRDLTMDTSELKAYGIVFADTVQALIRNFRNYTGE